jgi:uncharacterized membrane protein YhhN
MRDRLGPIIIAISAIFGAAYLFDDFGLSAPYPGNVAIKAAGIILLGGLALHRGHPLLAAGLLAGAAGDVFLALEPTQLSYGIAAFGIGHLIYIALFVKQLGRHGFRGPLGYVAAVALAGFGAAMLVWLQPYFGELQVAASVYNAIILIMAIVAVLGRAPNLAVIGALLFVVSDSVLALRLFADMLPWAGPVVWVTYYLGQAGIALGLSQRKR